MHHRAANGVWTVERPLALGSLLALRQVGNELWGVGEYGPVIRRQLP